MLWRAGGATNLPGGQRIRQMFFVQLGGGEPPVL
jgi:hypothetical protein